MFGGGGNKFKSAKVDTLIGNSAEVEGDVIYKGGLHVDGKVKGNVLADDDSDSMLILSERGVIEGEIRVPNVLLLNIRANRPWTAQNNALLAARDRPGDNIILVDWQTLSQNCTGSCFAADGIHLSADGQTFLMVQWSLPDDLDAQIKVVVNWFEEFERLQSE